MSTGTPPPVALPHWVISDTHCFHATIARYAGRPSDAEAQIVAHWRARVAHADTVLHLGAVAPGGGHLVGQPYARSFPFHERAPGRGPESRKGTQARSVSAQPWLVVKYHSKNSRQRSQPPGVLLGATGRGVLPGVLASRYHPARMAWCVGGMGREATPALSPACTCHCTDTHCAASETASVISPPLRAGIGHTRPCTTHPARAYQAGSSTSVTCPSCPTGATSARPTACTSTPLRGAVLTTTSQACRVARPDQTSTPVKRRKR
jgi:hypothetical protein